MGFYKFYFYVGLGFSALYTLIVFLGTPLLIQDSNSSLVQFHLDEVQDKAEGLAAIGAQFLKKDKALFIQTMQANIRDTEVNQTYLSVFDWSGKLICHPNNTQLGTVVSNQSYKVSEIDKMLTAEDIIALLQSGKTNEVAILTPIANSDMIIAGHINLEVLRTAIDSNVRSLRYGLTIIGLLSLLLVLAAVRFITAHYEKALSQKSLKIEDGVLNLNKLNDSLENYQKRASEQFQKPVDAKIDENEKERILTYVRNELRPISTSEIAYIYTENTITYIISKDGKRSTSNESLDQLYSYLNEKYFFRVNRQVIVAITAIDTIIKYGANSLKIKVNPESDIDIIIGKNKAASFKKWLDL